MKTIETNPERDSKDEFHRDRLMDLDEAAAYLKMSRVTMMRRIHVIPGFIFESRKIILFHPGTYLDVRLKRSVRWN